MILLFWTIVSMRDMDYMHSMIQDFEHLFGSTFWNCTIDSDERALPSFLCYPTCNFHYPVIIWREHIIWVMGGNAYQIIVITGEAERFSVDNALINSTL